MGDRTKFSKSDITLGLRGWQALGGLQGQRPAGLSRGAPQKLKIFLFSKTLKRPILEDKYKKSTSKQA